MLAYTGKKQPSVLASYGVYELQRWPACHDDPMGTIVCTCFDHN